MYLQHRLNDLALRGVLPTKLVGGGGLGPHIKFGGKIWSKVRPNSPNKRKNLGSYVTTRRKSWEKVPILGSYLKFRGQNLGICHLCFWRQKFGLQQEFQRQNLGQAPRPPNMEVPPWDLAGLLWPLLIILSRNSFSYE